MKRRRPDSFISLAAPLSTTRCECPDPIAIRTSDLHRRCIACAGIVEREPRLDTGGPG